MQKKNVRLIMLLVLFFGLYSFAYLERYSIASFSYGFLGVDKSRWKEWMYVFTFILYGIGNFMNGRMAQRIGGKKSVILGAASSCLLNILVSFTDQWYIAMILWGINGYLQSFLWLGGVLLIDEFCADSQKGLGIGVINGASGVAHILTFLYPKFLLADSSKSQLLILVMILFLFLAADERKIEKATLHKKGMLEKSKLWMWCGIAFCSSLCRYGLINWISVYYRSSFFRAVQTDYLGEIVLAAGMSVGTFLFSIVTEKFFKTNRALTMAAMAAACAMLVAIFPSQTEILTLLTCIFCTGAFLYGINGVFWLMALDWEESARISGILNGFAYLGAAVQQLLSFLVFSEIDNRFVIFFFMEALCMVMIILSVMICRKNTIILEAKMPQKEKDHL